MSLGEDRVRVEFKPGGLELGNELVVEIKQRSAELIDLCEAHRDVRALSNATVEVNRLWSLAQTAYEEGAMWAVKAATA